MRKLKKYKPTKFRAKGSYYDEESADFAVAFIESLCHTKGTWAGKRFELMKPTLEQRITHGGSPVLCRNMDNIFVRTDLAGNIKADKEKSTEKLTMQSPRLWHLTEQFAVEMK